MSEDTTAVAEPATIESVSTPDTTISVDTTPPPAGDGTFKNDMSDEFKNDPLLKNFHSLDDLAKSYISSQKTIGADKIVLPGSNATPEQLETFYSAIGRPDKATDYNLKAGEDTPEGLIPQPLIDQFSETSHTLGLTAAQANGVLKFYEGVGKEAVENEGKKDAEATESAINRLKTEFGQAFESKLSIANQALKRLAGDDYAEVQKELKMENVGSRPALVKVFAKVGEMMGESSLAGEGQAKTGRTPSEAAMEIGRLMGDKEFVGVYQSKLHPGHKAAVATMRQLYVEQVGEEVVVGGNERISSG